MTLLSILIAFVICAAGLPVARRVALASGLTHDVADQAEHGEPATRVPYLGGVAVVTATVIGGVLVGGGTSGRLGAAVAASTAVVLLGLLRDDREIRGAVLLAVEVLAAVVVVIAGIRLGTTGIAGVDAALSVAWIVVITNALRGLDTARGLAAGVGGVAASALLVLAALGHQQQLARVAGALAASCVAFLLFARGRAAITLGHGGSRFIGFVLAVCALELEPRVDRTAGALVPLLLLAVPLLDVVVVVFGRLRRGLPLGAISHDGLSDRLVRRGLRRGGAVGLLVVLEAVLATMAVMAGRSMLAAGLALAGAAALLLVVLVVAASAPVHTTPAAGLPRELRFASIAVAGLLLVATAAAGIAMLRAREPLRRGADTAAAALTAARDGDYQRASQLFAESRRAFAAARDRLEGPLPSLGLAVPVVSSNIRAARLLADVGSDLSATGRVMASEIRPERLRMQGGAVPLREIARIAPALRDAADAMSGAEREMQRAHRPYLLGPVSDAVVRVTEDLASVSETTERAARAAELAPAILGDEQPRRYFLAIQNNAESRATGGFLGNFGELVAEDGRISLVKFGSLDDLRDGGVPFAERTLDAPPEFTKRFADRLPDIKSWLHVNITPDFPTAARLISSLYPQSGGQEIDGVIAVDALGLAALLELTGPVDVAGWPVPLTAENIVRVTTREQYEPNLTYRERRDFLGAVAETVWRRVSSSDLGTPYVIANALGGATAGRHIQVALHAQEEERLVRRLGIDGSVGKPRSDSLMVVTHNGGGNKVDVYLDREISYRVRLEPDGDGTARVTGVVDVKLRNGAPSAGLPLGVLGDVNQPVKPGENFSLTSVYSPLRAAATLVDDKRYPFRSDPELARFAHSTYLKVAPRSRLQMQMLLDGRVRLAGGDTYVLDLLHQPRLAGDRVTVTVEGAEGWEIADAEGFREANGRKAIATFDQSDDRQLSVRLVSKGLAGLWTALTG